MKIETELEALQDLVRMLILDTLEGGDDLEHAWEFSEDGNGHDEPYSEHYQCVCGKWERTWSQTDHECSDRPDPAVVMLGWRQHVLDTYPKDESEGS